MKCEVCRENEASVPVRSYVDGNERVLHVCAGCAARALPKVMPLLSTVDLLLSTVAVASDAGAGSNPNEIACARCGMTPSNFKQNQRLGCGQCAEHFAQALDGMLHAMQPGDRHVGKTPARHKTLGALELLERALRAAVRTQNFEEAAVLRDRIRDLRASMEVQPGVVT